MTRESYIAGLAEEAIERTTAPRSLPLKEAIERASGGEGPFWSFDPTTRGGRVTGGHILVVEHYEDEEDVDPEDRWNWSIWLEGNSFADVEMGEEDSLGPGDDLTEDEHLRFVRVDGENAVGMMLSFSLANLLARPQEEWDQYL